MNAQSLIIINLPKQDLPVHTNIFTGKILQLKSQRKEKVGFNFIYVSIICFLRVKSEKCAGNKLTMKEIPIITGKF